MLRIHSGGIARGKRGSGKICAPATSWVDRPRNYQALQGRQNYSFTKVRMTSSRIRLRKALPELRVSGGGRYRRFSGRGRLRDERTENPASTARSVTHFEFSMKVFRKLQL